MRVILLAAALTMIGAPAMADDPTTAVATGPQEVGTTTMPPGQYYITEQTSHKSYSLTVTNKGNMILGAAPDGVDVHAAAAAPATQNSLTSRASSFFGSGSSTTSPGKSLVKEGVEKGMTEMIKQGSEKELQNFMK